MCRLLIFILIVLFFETSKCWSAREVINQLNKDLQLHLNIYLDCGDMELRFNQEVPNLLLNTLEEQQKLLGRFSARSLIIACLKESTENRTLNGIRELLWGIQHLHMIYIVNSKMDFYFKQALGGGFLHVLVLNNGTLYTYQPYPKIQIHQIKDMKEFYDLTKMRNLQGLAVHTTVETMTPRCFHYKNRQGKVVYAGYMYKLLKGFIETYNGTEKHVFANMETVPYKLGLSAFANGEIDMVPRIIHAMDWKYYHRSHIFYNIKTFLMVPWAEPLPKCWYFIQPFYWTVWITFIAGFIYASVLIWWIRFRQDEGSSLSSTFLDVLQLLFLLPVSKIWHFRLGIPSALSFIVLFTVGFILTNLYTAQLSSSLTTGLFKRQLNTFDDLFREKRIFLVESFDANVLHNMIKEKIIQKEFQNITQVTSIKEVFKLRKSLNTSYVYEAYEDRISFELLQQKYLRVPIFKTLKEVYDQRPVFVALRHGLPYVELVNDYLRRTWESGIWLKLQKDANFEGISSGEISFRKSKSWEIQVFDKDFYFFAYILLVLGWLAGAIVFLLEKIFRDCNRS
ncbi:glutamate receptor 2.5 [Drosophila rhopaloa]|uniref:Glutamate receptor 2.5 n=1 Tax=Drosophila rhopaloa TaxID=1041015 RepID=A0A6P4FUU9_DRORH|nr:glutamate receptor 2.5 [Drosophila rhopaloa]